MSIRIRIAAASIVSLGALTAACSAPATRTEPSASLSPTAEPSTPPPTQPQPAPGMHWLRVSPEQGASGSTVSLDIACLNNLGVVHSPVLDIGAVKGNPDGHQPWHLFGTATVRPDAKPGRYEISATCGASELSAAFTVVAAPSR